MNIGGGEVAGHLVQLLDAAVLAEPDGAAAEVLGAGAQEVVVSRVEEHPDAVRPAPVGAVVRRSRAPRTNTSSQQATAAVTEELRVAVGDPSLGE